MTKPSESRSKQQWVRALALRLGALSLSVLVTLVFFEILLRLVPQVLPTGHYGAGRFDPVLRLNVHGSSVVYNKVRFVQRTPNSRGFMDLEHPEKKPLGVKRVGFFGDSYVESIQLPLEDTFFRRAEDLIGPDRVETFSIGISGWGMLHSYLAYQALGDELDLDTVVYVFVANDVGDSSYALRRAQARSTTPSPTAVLSREPPGFKVRWPVDPDDLSLSYRLAKALQRRSLVVQLVYSRYVLFLKTRNLPDESAPTQPRMFRTGLVNENDLPSTWPPEVLREAREVSERILEEFSARVSSDGRRFFLLYVPRGTEEISGEIADEDLWLPWITTVTRRLNIPLLNPIEQLRERQEAGDPVYDDHWSPAGHEVLAQFLTDELCRRAAVDCQKEGHGG